MIPWWILLVLAILILTPAALLGWRRWRIMRPARSTPGPSIGTRLVEATVLALGGTLLLTIITWDDGLISYFPLARPEVQHAYLTALGIIGVGVLIAALATMYRAWVGLLLVMLAAAAMVVPNRRTRWWTILADDAAQRQAYLTFGENVTYPGVQLHVNGVHLGELPLTMTIDEFKAKVPYWDQPPEGFTEHPTYRDGKKVKVDRPWSYFEIVAWVDDPTQSIASSEMKRYYIQVQLGDEWGWSYPGGGGGSGGQVVMAEIGISARFPEFDKRIMSHIKVARAANGHVDAAWYETLAAFGRRGELTLLEQARRDASLEPILMRLVDERHHIAAVHDSESAWQALERIVAHAESQNAYSTFSLAGEALERIVPHLDRERLVEEGVRMVMRNPYSPGYRSRSDDGTFRFGTRRSHRDAHAIEPRPLRDYVIAHAIWKLHENLKAQNPDTPTVVQTRVLDALVYTDPSDEGGHNRAVELAIELDWPDLYRYLVRQPWREPVGEHSGDAMRVGATRINAWLYHLLHLDTPDGRTFRATYPRVVQHTAWEIVSGGHENNMNLDPDRLAFLFLDQHLGPLSPAAVFWPRYEAKVRRVRADGAYQSLYYRVVYLSRMEPHTTVDMYRQALVTTTGGDMQVIPDHELRTLAPDKRRAVLEAWREELQNLLENPPARPEPWMAPDNVKGSGMLQSVERELRQLDEHQP